MKKDKTNDCTFKVYNPTLKKLEPHEISNGKCHKVGTVKRKVLTLIPKN